MKEFILEYYINIQPKDSGVPIVIWLDNGQTYKNSAHSYRLKFEYEGERIPLMLPSLELPPTIQKSHKIKTSILNKVKEFAEKNMDLLMRMKDECLSDEIVRKELQSINQTQIKIEQQPISGYTTSSIQSNGVRRVENKDKKINFIDSNGKLIFDTWFDSASFFISIGETPISYASLNNEWYHLFLDGSYVKI